MPKLTAALADTHEALVIRLTALTAEVRAIALRRPGLPVPAEVEALAAGLLHDASGFAPKLGPLPAVAPTYSGLAVELSQALAALEVFEVRHTRWDRTRQAIVWHLASGATTPLRRLRPQLVPRPEDERRGAEMSAIKEKLVARIESLRRDSDELHALRDAQRDAQREAPPEPYPAEPPPAVPVPTIRSFPHL